MKEPSSDVRLFAFINGVNARDVACNVSTKNE